MKTDQLIEEQPAEPLVRPPRAPRVWVALCRLNGSRELTSDQLAAFKEVRTATVQRDLDGLYAVSFPVHAATAVSAATIANDAINLMRIRAHAPDMQIEELRVVSLERFHTLDLSA